MLDGLNENLRLVYDERARELSTAVWASGYAVGRASAVSLTALTELDCPHLGFVTEFCRQAVAANAGVSCVLLCGPRAVLYPARFLDLSEVRVRQRHRRNLTLADRVEHVNNALIRDGVCAASLEVPLGTRPPDTVTVYVTADRLYRPAGEDHPAWGERDELARQCASMLSPAR